MFRSLMQKLRGGGGDAPVEEAAAGERYDEVREERDDAAAGMVDGAGVSPTGEVSDFEADQQGPV